MTIPSGILQRKAVQPPKKTYSNIPLRSSAKKENQSSDDSSSSDDHRTNEDKKSQPDKKTSDVKSPSDEDLLNFTDLKTNNQIDEDATSNLINQNITSSDDIIPSDDDRSLNQPSYINSSKSNLQDSKVSQPLLDKPILSLSTPTINLNKDTCKISSNDDLQLDDILSSDAISITNNSIPKLIKKITFHGFSLREVRIINFIFSICYPKLFTPKKISLSEFFTIPGVDKSVFYKTINPLIESGVIIKIETKVEDGLRQESNLYSLKESFFT